MKLTLPTLRIAGALGLAAGLMIGCQDLMNPGQSATDPGTAATDGAGALSLSIKDDSACRGEWHAILDARSAGHPDSASEAAFLASCVTEVKPQKDKPKPIIPPALLPDSGTRCKWIVSQIEGGRDSLTVSYRKYCPDDCRKLETADSASHEKLCREPGPAIPPPHHEGDDTCRMLRMQLDSVKPGEPGRAELEHLFAARCQEPKPPCDTLPPGEPVPHDSIMPPPPPPPVNCDELRKKMMGMDTASADFARLAITLKEHCPVKPPLPDTAKLPPPPPPTTLDCDALRQKLALLDPASADYARLAVTVKEHCPELPAK